MASRAAELVAEIIDGIDGRLYGTGRPRVPTVRVVETLRFFIREAVQWRELWAATGRACRFMRRRRLEEWSAAALLRLVHVVLIRMVIDGMPAGWLIGDTAHDADDFRRELPRSEPRP